MITQIRKRNGTVVPFDKEKVINAIFKAAQSVGGEDRKEAAKLADEVVGIAEKQFENMIPSVEDLQDVVEKVLISSGHAKTAKAYILWRDKRAQVRRYRGILGIEDDLKLPLNTLMVLGARYLRRDESRNVVETPRQMFARVAKAVAEIDKNHGAAEEETGESEKEFFEMMVGKYFMPNSPTLMNAGTDLGQLSACFVLPVEDNTESIFEAVKQQALVHKSGGGTGFSFSRLRPKNDVVRKTGGISSGPITFMRVFDVAADVIKQGGKRRGANMGILRVDHPDILDFIMTKERDGILSNFNLSVAITDKFMKAVLDDKDYDLVNPRTKKAIGKLNARAIWNLIVTMAWKTGDPGIIFIDRINTTESNPVPYLGPVESTNPCGEQPLLPYESCNLGSINLGKFVVKEDGKMTIDWTKLQDVIRKSVHFLDNVIDANKYPLPQIDEMTKRTRRIGLGIMGWADMLILLGIPYNSEQALQLAERIMHFISVEGRKMSIELAMKRGNFPEFEKSIWKQRGFPAMRNATITTIAPTGTISIISECSQGIEPHFAIAYMRNVGETLGTGENLIEITPIFEKMAIEEGFYSDDFMKKILKSWSIQHIEEVPEKIRRVFVTAHDISPEWHVRMQAAFQKYTDNAVSKTINFPSLATPHDVEKTYILAYKAGCKGITIFRDQSRSSQVITLAEPGQKTLESQFNKGIEDYTPEVFGKADGGKTVDAFYTGDVKCKDCQI